MECGGNINSKYIKLLSRTRTDETRYGEKWNKESAGVNGMKSNREWELLGQFSGITDKQSGIEINVGPRKIGVLAANIV